MNKYFILPKAKEAYITTLQGGLQPDDFFAPEPKLKTTHFENTTVKDQLGNDLQVRYTRPVYVVETDLENLFADLQANSEFSTEDPTQIFTYLLNADGV